MNKSLAILMLLLLSVHCFSQNGNDTISNIRTLKDVTIVVKDPISEKFSVQKLGKMDIYLNPASNADPLKAISILPASTNVEETANPSLRGGSADRCSFFQ